MLQRVTLWRQLAKSLLFCTVLLFLWLIIKLALYFYSHFTVFYKQYCDQSLRKLFLLPMVVERFHNENQTQVKDVE